ncbi:hypothetical protein [Xanthomonas phaseoli]|uniref:hypothetical protein n=1 Tax=Xanthomonas phaseoli TaxID=1985254 RepID=UPI00037A4147|nr:hypothetical protein [Xanthomonas phaseoli]
MAGGAVALPRSTSRTRTHLDFIHRAGRGLARQAVWDQPNLRRLLVGNWRRGRLCLASSAELAMPMLLERLRLQGDDDAFHGAMQGVADVPAASAKLKA